MTAGLLWPLAWTVACERSPPPPAGAVVLDSAGVEIVLNAADAVTRRSWQVGPAPVFDIGGADNGPAYRFSRIRGVARLSDGRIVVADGESRQVRYYTARAEHIRSIGREGDAPGEFEEMWLVGRRPDDGIVVWDPGLDRFTSFDAEGTLLRVWTPAADLDRMTPWSLFDDGLILASSANQAVPAPDGTPRRDTTTLWLFDSTAGRRSPILRAAGTSSIVRAEYVFLVPFTGNPVFDTSGDDVFTTIGPDPAIERWSRDGVLEARFHDGREPYRVVEADISRYRERALRSLGDGSGARELMRQLAAMPWPRHRPAYDRLLVGSDGRIWVRDWADESSSANRWIVFEPTGEVLGSVLTPADLEVTQIDTDLLLGSARDREGIEHVRAYRVAADMPRRPAQPDTTPQEGS